MARFFVWLAWLAACFLFGHELRKYNVPILPAILIVVLMVHFVGDWLQQFVDRFL